VYTREEFNVDTKAEYSA